MSTVTAPSNPTTRERLEEEIREACEIFNEGENSQALVESIRRIRELRAQIQNLDTK